MRRNCVPGSTGPTMTRGTSFNMNPEMVRQKYAQPRHHQSFFPTFDIRRRRTLHGTALCGCWEGVFVPDDDKRIACSIRVFCIITGTKSK